MISSTSSAIDNLGRNSERIERTLLSTLLMCLMILSVPDTAFAQASPFLTGANAIQTNILTWLTPVAIILVMVLGAMAMANRMSWGWCIGAVIGIAIAFGAPQIVTWIRGMFAV
jgi:type IV secretion system protein VirB2